jgi:hypothetical protein
MATDEELSDLQIIQNRVLRLILKKGPRTSIGWMLNALKIMSVKQRVYFNTLVLIFKVKNNMLPEYMSEEVQFNRDATERVLRNTNDFRLPKYNKSCTQNSMWHAGLKLFNELPTEIKNTINIDAFKKAVEPWIKVKCPVS